MQTPVYRSFVGSVPLYALIVMLGSGGLILLYLISWQGKGSGTASTALTLQAGDSNF